MMRFILPFFVGALAFLAMFPASAQERITPEMLLEMDADEWTRTTSALLQPERSPEFIALCNESRERRIKNKYDEWLLSHLYDAFEATYKSVGAAARSPIETFVQNRMRDNPDDRTWPVMYVECLITDAWQARGSGWANTVTEDGWAQFHAKLEAAYDELSEMLPEYPDDLEPYSQMVTVCMGLGRPSDEIYSYYRKALKIDPFPRRVAGRLAYAMLPRWLGEGDGHDLRKLAEWSTQQTSDYGEAMYTFVASATAAWDGADTVLNDYGFDLDRIVQGAKDYQEYVAENPYYIHRACQFACAAEKREIAAGLFANLEYSTLASDVWSESAFQSWQLWATGNGAPPKTTPLHLAAQSGSLTQVETALANGADVNAVDQTGKSAIQIAALDENWDIVSLLLSKGADPNLATRDENTPLAQAVKTAAPEIVAALITAGADVNHLRDNFGALQLAARRGDTEIMSELLKAKDVDVNLPGPKHFTPLLTSVSGGFSDCARLLLEAGADVSVPATGGWTPLSAAIQFHDLDLIKALVEHGADPYSSAPSGWTALHMAIASENFDIADYLLSQPNASINTPMADGWAPIHQVAKEGKMSILEYLLKKPDLAINQTVEESGNTALHYAAREGFSDAVALLIEHGADTTIKNDDGNTAWDLAKDKGFVKMEALLNP